MNKFETILFVDDDEMLTDFFSEFLEDNGYSVVVAENGLVALEKFATMSIDLVITDVFMPEMDGIDFVTKLLDLFPDTPILATSGGAKTVKAQFCLDTLHLMGVKDYLAKPVTSKVLLATIQAMEAKRGD
jgi:CheY-like chemotaxis protein